MEQIVKVVKTHPDGTARVVHIRESACSGDCHKCSGCGAAKQTLFFTAENCIGAQVGDTVIVQSPSKPVLAAAAIFYLIPTVMFIAMYLVGMLLWDRGMVTALAGFLLAVLGAVVYDRRVLKNKKTQYRIIGYGGERT